MLNAKYINSQLLYISVTCQLLSPWLTDFLDAINELLTASPCLSIETLLFFVRSRLGDQVKALEGSLWSVLKCIPLPHLICYSPPNVFTLQLSCIPHQIYLYPTAPSYFLFPIYSPPNVFTSHCSLLSCIPNLFPTNCMGIYHLKGLFMDRNIIQLHFYVMQYFYFLQENSLACSKEYVAI